MLLLTAPNVLLLLRNTNKKYMRGKYSPRTTPKKTPEMVTSKRRFFLSHLLICLSLLQLATAEGSPILERINSEMRFERSISVSAVMAIIVKCSVGENSNPGSKCNKERAPFLQIASGLCLPSNKGLS